MNEQMARKLQQVGNKFNLPGPFFSYEEINVGNVNHTYRADYIRDDGTGMARIKSYLVQQVNTYAFRDPVALMDNIDKVTEYIHAQRPNQTCLHYHHTADRNTYVFDGDEFWRICNYVPSVTYDTCDNLEIVRSAAEAFGDFQMVLSDFDASQLSYTIPDFHNTRKRYETLIKDIKEDKLGRVKNVQEEIDYLLRVQDLACKLTDMEKAGQLPLRVTHNDTKINNVLFDKVTHEPLVVIDLDTVMPGSALYDFGDAIRYGACTAAEDETDLSRVALDIDLFRGFTDGFISQTANGLTRTELENLPLGALVMTYENGLRFLADYLDGDQYFRVEYPEHNLVRARCQFRLLADMEAKRGEMDRIVRELIEKYR